MLATKLQTKTGTTGQFLTTPNKKETNTEGLLLHQTNTGISVTSINSKHHFTIFRI